MRSLENSPPHLIRGSITVHNLRFAGYDIIISIFSDPTVKLKTLKVLYCRMLLAAPEPLGAIDRRMKLLLLLETQGDRTAANFNFDGKYI
ncbi:MAG: hypothetical protein HC942_08225 [Microcoleus sp. SU_5_6]|nr:hypothetical protein [Microcoleus sp. SU_5_6]